MTKVSSIVWQTMFIFGFGVQGYITLQNLVEEHLELQGENFISLSFGRGGLYHQIIDHGVAVDHPVPGYV